MCVCVLQLLYISYIDHSHDRGSMVICYVEKVLELIGSQCRTCSCQCNVPARIVGCTLVVKVVCIRGLVFSWASSSTIVNANKSALYRTNFIFASAVLLSGNNFYKILQLCHFMGLKCILPSTYLACQRLCFSPAVQVFYDKEMVSLFVVSASG